MSYSQNPFTHTWGAMHDNRLTNDRELDAKDVQRDCNHAFTTWAGNPMISRCAKCAEWHYKD